MLLRQSFTISQKLQIIQLHCKRINIAIELFAILQLKRISNPDPRHDLDNKEERGKKSMGCWVVPT